MHYARSGFAVRPVGDRELDVERTDAPDEEQARREIETHLLVWDVLHPDVPARSSTSPLLQGQVQKITAAAERAARTWGVAAAISGRR